MINIFIDDLREPPTELEPTELFVCRTSDQALARLAFTWTAQRWFQNDRYVIDQLYLDHDLGPGDTIEPVVDFISTLAAWEVELTINTIFVITQNPVASEWMTKQLQQHYPNVHRK